MLLALKLDPPHAAMSEVRIDHGAKMELHPDDEVDRRIYFNVMDEEIKYAIGKYVRANATALDVGANIGYFSLILAHAVGQHGKVHAFEPHPALYPRLQQHVIRNGFANTVEVHSCAVADFAGTVQFRLRADGGSSLGPRAGLDWNPIETPVDSLDAMIQHGELTPPGFMKIDVEGAEMQVLRGAEQLIREFRPVIVSEVGPLQQEFFGYSIVDLWDWAAARGYSMGLLNTLSGCRPLTRNSAAAVRRGNVLLMPGPPTWASQKGDEG
jgi:FkbM family methyltransferase